MPTGKCRHHKPMSLYSELLDLKGKGGELTYPQSKFLYNLTMLKWWAPELLPKPNIPQAKLLIDACLKFSKQHEGGSDLLEAIQIWFPSFNQLESIHSRFFHKKESDNDVPEPKENGNNHGNGKSHGNSKTAKNVPERKSTPAPERKPEPMPTPEPERKPEPKPTPVPENKPKEKAPEPKPTPAPDAKSAKGMDELNDKLRALIKNIWLVGPAGCGKTTICLEAGKIAEMPVTVIPCGAGTTSTTFLGRTYPEREGTPFVHAFSQEGIIVLDEFTALDAQVAQIVNGALANDELSSTIGTFHRHHKCIIIATSNTFGHGADRLYVSNNQLDASTIDRFTGGIIEIDYSREYERQYDMEVVNYVWRLRDVIKRNGLREIASTRSIIAGCQLKNANCNWKDALIKGWTEDEKRLIA
jgi:hypothetical protein